MPVEIKMEDRVVWVNLISQNGNLLEVEVNGKIYHVDLLHTLDGTFSILTEHKSDEVIVLKNETNKGKGYS
ncbi:MAG: hypothetical protein EOM73_15700, partial [Bacteroidia bacterium]|nr:hypothetical protein [Bacteroidia bacterium]